MNENKLIELAKKDDPEVISSIYNRYVDQIYRYFLFNLNQNTEEAKDLTQETFIAAFRSIKKFRGESSFKNWLYAISKNILKKYIFRKNLFRLEPLYETIVFDPFVFDPEEIEKTDKKINKLLTYLSNTERSVVVFRYLRGLSIKEVSLKLKLSESNVKIISHRAIQKLKNIDYNSL